MFGKRGGGGSGLDMPLGGGCVRLVPHPITAQAYSLTQNVGMLSLLFSPRLCS